MKKLFMILLASMALAACGGGNNSEANRTEDMDGTEQSVSPESGTMGSDTTNTGIMSTDSTSTMDGVGTGTTGGSAGTAGDGTTR